MTYAVQRSLGTAPVGVGRRAFSDPVLARASLDASSILLSMARAVPERRLPILEAGLARLNVDSGEVVAEMKRGLAARENPDQVTFDALRLAIANARVSRGLDNIRHDVASRSGWDSLVDAGLGAMSANDKATACMIAAGAQTAGGIASIIPVYGTIVGGVVGIGAGIAGGALDCGKEARDAAAAAAQAQAQLAAAQEVAATQQAAILAASRQRRIKTLVGGGAILAAVLGVAWLVLD